MKAQLGTIPKPVLYIGAGVVGLYIIKTYQSYTKAQRRFVSLVTIYETFQSIHAVYL